MNADLRGLVQELCAIPEVVVNPDYDALRRRADVALSVAQGQGFVMVPGVYVDPHGKPVLTNEGDNMTPAILARRGLRPVYELTETREPDKPIPENCRHDWATDGMGDYCRYCKKREDSLFPAAPAQPDGVE